MRLNQSIGEAEGSAFGGTIFRDSSELDDSDVSESEKSASSSSGEEATDSAEEL